jgi:hypothetical protein
MRRLFSRRARLSHPCIRHSYAHADEMIEGACVAAYQQPERDCARRTEGGSGKQRPIREVQPEGQPLVAHAPALHHGDPHLDHQHALRQSLPNPLREAFGVNPATLLVPCWYHLGSLSIRREVPMYPCSRLHIRYFQFDGKHPICVPRVMISLRSTAIIISDLHSARTQNSTGSHHPCRSFFTWLRARRTRDALLHGHAPTLWIGIRATDLL